MIVTYKINVKLETTVCFQVTDNVIAILNY